MVNEADWNDSESPGDSTYSEDMTNIHTWLGHRGRDNQTWNSTAEQQEPSEEAKIH